MIVLCKYPMASGLAADEPMYQTAPEEPGVPVDVSVTHGRQGEDRVKDDAEESNTRVPGCQSDLLPKTLTPSLSVAVDSKPPDSVQEITEVEASGSREESKKGIDELMQEVIFVSPSY